ncbi:MAG: hypothetical protein LUQ62_00095 [Methanomicrobiales archaeon]|nr:hypothetical protein [Methanomicrobiales archaeon]
MTGWIYLGDRPEVAIGLEKFFRDNLRRVSISGLLQDTAHSYRHRYIDYIGALTGAHCHIPWFLTSLSEKNPFASTFYLSFCSMVACMEYLSTARGNVIVVCGSEGIQAALAENLRARHAYEILYCRSRMLTFRDAVLTRLLGTVMKFWFAARYAVRILVASAFHRILMPEKVSSLQEPLVLIHAWTDLRSFRTPGTFWDIFYGDLVSILSPDAKVRYVIDVLPTIAYLKALYFLRGIRDADFILQEFYLTLPDIPRALRAKREGYRDLGAVPPLDGILVDALVREEMKGDSLSTRGEQSFLCYCAARRIAAAHPARAYLYTFENHMWEKCTLKGLRECRPETRTVGYAHTLVYPMNLPYSLAESEASCTPLPDLILANGKHPRGVLIDAGFSGPSIHVSGALRYGSFRQPEGAGEEGDRNAVLLAGSVSIPRTIELIHKAFQAFDHAPETPVWIKCHPNLPFSRLRPLLPPLPSHFTVREEPVESLLPGTGVVLYTESTVAVEAAAWGIPVIHVKLDCSLDMNIFAGLPQVPSVSSPEEIQRSARDLMIRRAGQVQEVRKHIGSLFEPVDPVRIRSLVLQGHLPEGGESSTASIASANISQKG